MLYQGAQKAVIQGHRGFIDRMGEYYQEVEYMIMGLGMLFLYLAYFSHTVGFLIPGQGRVLFYRLVLEAGQESDLKNDSQKTLRHFSLCFGDMPRSLQHLSLWVSLSFNIRKCKKLVSI